MCLLRWLGKRKIKLIFLIFFFFYFRPRSVVNFINARYKSIKTTRAWLVRRVCRPTRNRATSKHYNIIVGRIRTRRLKKNHSSQRRRGVVVLRPERNFVRVSFRRRHIGRRSYDCNRHSLPLPITPNSIIRIIARRIADSYSRHNNNNNNILGFLFFSNARQTTPVRLNISLRIQTRGYLHRRVTTWDFRAGRYCFRRDGAAHEEPHNIWLLARGQKSRETRTKNCYGRTHRGRIPTFRQ